MIGRLFCLQTRKISMLNENSRRLSERHMKAFQNGKNMVEYFHNCSMCMYSCTSTNTLLKHTIKEHKNDPNFLVHCTICGKYCNKWNSFQRHVKRKHKYEQNCHDDEEEKNIFAHNVINTPIFSYISSYKEILRA